MQDDVGTIINCTFRGIEVAGNFTKEGIRGVAKIMLFLLHSTKALGIGVFKVGKGAWNLGQQHRVTKSGKISKRTMKEKYGDAIIYKDMKIVEDVLRKNESRNPNSLLDTEALKEIRPNKKEQISHFKKMAKKHGLNYVMFPNSEGGYILQIPKDQEAKYEKVYELHCSWIKKVNMEFNKEIAHDIKESKVTGQDVHDKMTSESKEVVKNPYPSLSREQVFEIIANLKDEQYNQNMKETFQGYNEQNRTIEQIIEELRGDGMLTEEKKKELFRMFADQDQVEAKSKGLVKEFNVKKSNLVIQERDGRTTISFPDPEHLNTVITVNAESLCGRMKWNGDMANFCLYKDSEISATTSKLVIQGEVGQVKKTEYKGNLVGLEEKILSDAQIAKKTHERSKKKRLNGSKRKVTSKKK